MSALRSLAIVGLGNVLCADDGLGVRAVAELPRRFRVPRGVQLLDGGTLGLGLLSWIAEHDALILVDAVRDGDRRPGSLVRLEAEEVEPAVRERLSVHQVGVADLLDALRLLDREPAAIVLHGLVPESLELRCSLSPSVERNLDRLVTEVALESGRLGFAMRPWTASERAAAASADAGRSAPSPAFS